MLVTVTAEHVRSGERSMSHTCPVALAMKEVCQHDVSVGFTMAQGLGKYWDLPKDVSERIAKYDVNGIMLPFSFEAEEYSYENQD